jgi:phosphomannomutase
MSGVFKLYDIRGIYGKDLTDELLYKIGYAFGRYFNNHESIGIVRDIRLSSPRIRDILVETLVYTHNVIDFGIGSTPEAHYLAKVYNIPVLMITASHNPSQYNGIKPIKSDGNDLPKEEIDKIEKLTYENIRPTQKEGMLEVIEGAIDIYKKHLKEKFKGVSGFKVGYDPGP